MLHTFRHSLRVQKKDRLEIQFLDPSSADLQELQEQLSTLFSEIKSSFLRIEYTAAQEKGRNTSLADAKLNEHKRKSAANGQKLFDRFGLYKQTLIDFIELVDRTRTLMFDHIGSKLMAPRSFVGHLDEMVRLFQDFTAPSICIAVCGETSVGKTTFLSGVIGYDCLPTDTSANTACPIRIEVDNSMTYPCLKIPSKFR